MTHITNIHEIDQFIANMRNKLVINKISKNIIANQIDQSINNIIKKQNQIKINNKINQILYEKPVIKQKTIKDIVKKYNEKKMQKRKHENDYTCLLYEEKIRNQIIQSVDTSLPREKRQHKKRKYEDKKIQLKEINYVDTSLPRDSKNIPCRNLLGTNNYDKIYIYDLNDYLYYIKQSYLLCTYGMNCNIKYCYRLHLLPKSICKNIHEGKLCYDKKCNKIHLNKCNKNCFYSHCMFLHTHDFISYDAKKNFNLR